MINWFVVVGDQEKGPFTSAQLKQLAAEGKLNPQHRLRREDLENVVNAAQVRGLFGSPVAPSSTPQQPPQSTPVASPASQTAISPRSSQAGPHSGTAARPSSPTVREWYLERFGKLSIAVQVVLWMLGGYLWIPAFALLSGVDLGRLKYPVWAWVGLFALVFVTALGNSTGSPAGGSSLSDRELLEAGSMAKEVVKQHLKFPLEADFPWGLPETASVQAFPGLAIVSGTVASKNAFGVRGNIKWVALMHKHDPRGRKYDPSAWKCYGLMMNGEAMAVDPAPEKYEGAAVLLGLAYSQRFGR